VLSTLIEIDNTNPNEQVFEDGSKRAQSRRAAEQRSSHRLTEIYARVAGYYLLVTGIMMLPFLGFRAYNRKSM